MNTSSDTTLRARSPRSAACALLSLLAAMWAAGCGELPPDEASHLREARSAIDPCPTGVCTGNGNGPGIFISQRRSYCIPGLVASTLFCPEYFTVDLADPQQPALLLGGQRVAVAARPATSTLEAQVIFNNRGVEVLGLSHSSSAGLVITVREGGSAFDVTGSDLSNLVLKFNSTDFHFLLRFTPHGTPTGLPMYAVEYSVGPSSWESYCGGLEAAAFLPGHKVNGVRAGVEVSGASVTMACASGAIVSCMYWGYRPHEATGDAADEARDLFGACLQAKRAAYFGLYNDFSSYTLTGIHLARHDNKGIQTDVMPGVEALWGPQGAVCFNPEFRRLHGLDSDPLPALPAHLSLPECADLLNSAAQQGMLYQFLTETAPLATGPVPD